MSIQTIKDLRDVVSKCDNSEIVEKVHFQILSFNKKITFRIFPIYIKYFLEDKVVGIIYFKGKFVNPKKLVLGFNLSTKPKLVGFKNAGFMKDPNITYSIVLDDNTSDKNIKEIIKLIEC
jgi:hypothetical protein